MARWLIVSEWSETMHQVVALIETRRVSEGQPGILLSLADASVWDVFANLEIPVEGTTSPDSGIHDRRV